MVRCGKTKGYIASAAVRHPFSSRTETSVFLVSQMESHLSNRRRISLSLRSLWGPINIEATRGVMGGVSRNWRRRTRARCRHPFVESVALMPKGVQLAQIERIFEILDRLEISREAVIIPLQPQGSGGVKRLSNGKLEIIVPADTPFEEWYASLEGAIKAVYPA